MHFEGGGAGRHSTGRRPGRGGGLRAGASYFNGLLSLQPVSFLLGIAGGLGSGKTALARTLERRGVPVFFADDEAKRLYTADPSLHAAIVETFGPEMYRPDGSLDRARMAAHVFADPAELARLNALIHPRVFAHWKAFVAEHAAAPVVAHESAILFESGGNAHVDAVVWVDAPREMRVARALERDPHLSREHIEARMARQIDAAEGRRRADFVVENTGTLADVDVAAERLLAQLASAP